MISTSTPELLPCPFCKCELKFCQRHIGDDVYEHPNNDCVLATAGDLGDPLNIFAVPTLIAAWNRRTEPADIAALTDAEIIGTARRTLDNGLCLDRTARITRATDAEIIDFARALLAAQGEKNG